MKYIKIIILEYRDSDKSAEVLALNDAAKSANALRDQAASLSADAADLQKKIDLTKDPAARSQLDDLLSKSNTKLAKAQQQLAAASSVLQHASDTAQAARTTHKMVNTFGYQEIDDTNPAYMVVVRLTDEAGNTLSLKAQIGYAVLDDNPPMPSWGKPTVAPAKVS